MESAENPIHKTHPRAANHVGVGVSDIKEAVRRYQEILGFTLLKGPMEVHAEQGYRADEVHDVLGPEVSVDASGSHGRRQRIRHGALPVA
jgi:catechol 2,3-dioxygenase-like lactoylglutathione lyase family enzyme